MNNKFFKLKELIFLTLCSDIGIIVKTMVSPAAKVITDYINVPGGISTAFSLSFIVMGSVVVNKFGSATIMCVIQCFVSFATGHVGSMGALMPIAYLLPGLSIDICLVILKKLNIKTELYGFILNTIASAITALAVNCLVYRLTSYALILYIGIAALSGGIVGLAITQLMKKIETTNIFNFKVEK